MRNKLLVSALLALSVDGWKTMAPWDFVESAGRPKSRNGTGRRTGVAAAKRAAKAARHRKGGR